MFNVLLLIKALFMVNLCQGLTIYQTDYENHRGHEQKSKFPTPDNNLMAIERENLKTTSGSITNQASESSSNYAHATPYQNGLIMNILSQTKANTNEPSSAYYLENFAHIQPIFYEYSNPVQTTASIVNEQPVHAVNTESEINHHKAPFEAAKSSWKAIQTLPVNFNNKIYHMSRRASPLANNDDQKYPSNIVRKQRNLNENLYNNNNTNEINNNNDADDKLIEPETSNVSDKPGDRNAISLSSIKQPLLSSMTSHEIRYLHDIFLNYPKPHHVNYGHVEFSPLLFEKRFETLKAGNRYKGEVLWLDNTGGYTQHYWDLAQEKL